MLPSCLHAAAALALTAALPFAEEENRDGARFLWLLLTRADIAYEYMPARDFPASPRWEPVPARRRRSGDVAWWRDFVALYTGRGAGGADLGTAAGPRRLADLEREKGPARFLRLSPPPAPAPAPRRRQLLGRWLRYANPDPGSWAEGARAEGAWADGGWAEGAPNAPAGSGSVTLQRRAVRDLGGRDAVPRLAVGLHRLDAGVSLADLARAPPEHRVEATEETSGAIRRRSLFLRDGVAFRELAVHQLSGGLALSASCAAPDSAWRLVEPDCRTFLDSVAIDPLP